MIDNELTITHLSYREKISKVGKVPFLEFNCTFRVSQGSSLFSRVLSDSQPCRRTLPCKISGEGINYENLPLTWPLQDPKWNYIQKFDTFWMHELVSDCYVTRACIEELQFYQEHGVFSNVFRHTDGSVALRHLETIFRYWD